MEIKALGGRRHEAARLWWNMEPSDRKDPGPGWSLKAAWGEASGTSKGGDGASRKMRRAAVGKRDEVGMQGSAE